MVLTVIAPVVIALSLTGARASFGATSTEHPSQSIDCTAISADYHRPLQNGDHINVSIKRPDGSTPQVNTYVDQNIVGGASYNGQNNLGLRITIFGQQQAAIPLSLDQILSGVITFNYASYLHDFGLSQWTVTFVQTNSTDTWPNTECGEAPSPSPTPTHTASPSPSPTKTPEPTASPTKTPEPTSSPTPTTSPTPTASPTKTPKPTTSPSPSPTKTPSPTASPSTTSTPSSSPSSTPVPSTTTPAGTKPPTTGGLAVTGGTVAWGAGVVSLLLLAGGGLFIIMNKRRRAASK
jgi:hypothetical protein